MKRPPRTVTTTVLLTALMVATITGSGIAWVVLAALVLRGADIEARALHYITGESRQECTKMAAVLFGVIGGTIAVVGYFIS